MSGNRFPDGRDTRILINYIERLRALFFIAQKCRKIRGCAVLFTFCIQSVYNLYTNCYGIVTNCNLRLRFRLDLDLVIKIYIILLYSRIIYERVGACARKYTLFPFLSSENQKIFPTLIFFIYLIK